MKAKGMRPNPMLTEMLIVLLFFALSACVLVGVFSSAYKSGEIARSETEALLWAEDLAERFCLSNRSADEFLEGEGWEALDGEYLYKKQFSRTEYSFTAKPFALEYASGEVRGFDLSAVSYEKMMFSLPASNFIAREGVV